MKSGKLRSFSAETISYAVFYSLIALVVVMFGAFYLFGYDNPYYDNPDFNAPKLSGALITFSICFVAAAFAMWLCAVFIALRKRRGEGRVADGIPLGRIKYSVIAVVAVVVVTTFAFGSTSHLIVNGESYDNCFWLRTADMFINTALTLFVLAVASVVFGFTRYARKKRR